MPEELNLNVAGREITATVIRRKRRSAEALLSEVMKAFVDPSMLAKASSQPEDDVTYTVLISGSNCETPPVPLSKYRELYRHSAVHAACCDAKVSYIAGQGYRIRPRAELFPRMDDWSPNRGNEGPDTQKQNAILNFLEIPQRGGNSFVELLQAMWLDVETQGQGYIEFSRSGEATIDGMYSVKGETMLVAKGGPKKGFWQKRGTNVQFFAPYLGMQEPRYVRIVRAVVPGTEHTIHKAKTYHPRSTKEGLDLLKAGAKTIAQDDKTFNTRVNELLMFCKDTPMDTSYGEPDIIKALDDYLIAQGIRKYDISYFDNATVPRIMILVEGDTTFSQPVVNELERFLESNTATDALQQSLILQVPADSRVRVEPLQSAHLSDSEALVVLREKSEGFVKLAHRTPDSVLPGAGQSDREATRTFMASVVRPNQRRIESRLNWVFASELGIKDWVIDLQVPDLVDEKTLHETWDIALRRGYLTINEVRQKLNMPPVDGGDKPFVLVPGQGQVLISGIEEVTSRIAAGAKVNDLLATGDVKTPPKGMRPLDADQTSLAAMADKRGKAVALLVDPEFDFSGMETAEKAQIQAFLEQIVINRDDVGLILDTDA